MKSLLLKLTSLVCLLSIMSLNSCKLFEPQPFEYEYSNAYYNNWFEVRKVEKRGYKYRIYIEGERLHFFKAKSLIIGPHKLTVESEIVEADQRDLSSTLIITAYYIESKAKNETDFKEVENSLMGLEPFENAVLEYELEGKIQTLVIDKFTRSNQF